MLLISELNFGVWKDTSLRLDHFVTDFESERLQDGIICMVQRFLGFLDASQASLRTLNREFEHAVGLFIIELVWVTLESHDDEMFHRVKDTVLRHFNNRQVGVFENDVVALFEVLKHRQFFGLASGLVLVIDGELVRISQDEALDEESAVHGTTLVKWLNLKFAESIVDDVPFIGTHVSEVAVILGLRTAADFPIVTSIHYRTRLAGEGNSCPECGIFNINVDNETTRLT